MTIDKSTWYRRLIVVGVFGVVGFVTLNAPSLKGEISGVVEIAGMDGSSKWQLPQEIVRVRLGNGEVVTAKVSLGVVALKGAEVQMRVYERILTNASSYEVYSSQSSR